MTDIESSYKTLRNEQEETYDLIVKLKESFSKANSIKRKKYVLKYQSKLDLQVQKFKANNKLLQALDGKDQLCDKSYFTVTLPAIQDLIESFNQLLATYSVNNQSEDNSASESNSSDDSTMTD